MKRFYRSRTGSLALIHNVLEVNDDGSKVCGMSDGGVAKLNKAGDLIAHNEYTPTDFYDENGKIKEWRVN